jgi:hypothetical protein
VSVKDHSKNDPTFLNDENDVFPAENVFPESKDAGNQLGDKELIFSLTAYIESPINLIDVESRDSKKNIKDYAYLDKKPKPDAFYDAPS